MRASSGSAAVTQICAASSSGTSARNGAGNVRPRSPSHAAKNKTPEDRVCEFGWMLAQRDGRLVCRACNLNLDHTRRSTIVEHLRSRKHQRFLEESDLELLHADAASVAPIVLMEICDDEASLTNTQNSFDRPSSRASPTAGMTGPYLLKKETHCTTILDQLLRDDTFADVTLTADGQSIRAHKIVLCLASAYFRQVLSREAMVQNVIVFRDIRFNELKNIVNFIYTGEATVDASELESFMRTAELLEINSLCEGSRNLPKTFSGIQQKESEKTFQGKTNSKRTTSSNVTTSYPYSPPPKARKVSDSSGGVLSSRVSRVSSSATSAVRSLPVSPNVNVSSVSQSRPMASNSPSPMSLSAMVKSEPESEEIDVVPDYYEDGGSPKGRVIDGGDESADMNDQMDVVKREPQNDIDATTCGKCPFCAETSSQAIRSASSLAQHLQTNHPDRTAFVCQSCCQTFLKKSSYESHKNDCFS